MDFWEDEVIMPDDMDGFDDEEFDDEEEDFYLPTLEWQYSYVWAPIEAGIMNELGEQGFRAMQGTMRVQEIGGVELIQILMEKMTCR